MKSNFDIELLPEASHFLDILDNKTREKIYYNIRKAQIVNDEELFKKLNEFIWEFRTLYNGKTYRLFSFWDKSSETETMVIATHGILKKHKKHPKKKLVKQKRLESVIWRTKIKRDQKWKINLKQ